jgi:endogenous inhibitor of DNA gyrase (YacG/DUF329 family)
MRIVCPICKTVLENAPDDHPVRPFCSQRCKSADLYNWLSGEYRISTPLDPGEVGDDEVKLS